MIILKSADGIATAKIDQRGASLREIWVDSTQVAGAPDSFSGSVLYPWPNRIQDGQWVFEGKKLQLPINEPASNSALHGLVWDKTFDILNAAEQTCQLGLDLSVTEGFPFSSRVEITYTLSNEKIDVIAVIKNYSKATMPFAIGFHPYFLVSLDSSFSVAYKENLLEGVHLDQTYTTTDGPIKVRSQTKKFEISSPLKYLHVYTGSKTPEGLMWLALEPQTSPSNSLNSGLGLNQLSAGDHWSTMYSISWTN